MNDVIKKMYISDTDSLALDMGQVQAPWANGSQVFFDAPIDYNFAYSTFNDYGYMQYGFNRSPWATVRCFRNHLVINSQVTNNDGSVDVNFTLSGLQINSYKTVANTGVGFDVRYEISQRGILEYTWSGSTTDEWSYISPNSFTDNVRIPANSSYRGTAIQLKIIYPNHEYEDFYLDIGLTLFNTIPPLYTPNFYKKNNVGVGVNGSGKSNAFKKSNTLNIVKKELYTTINSDNGNIRVKKNNARKQARAYNDSGGIVWI